MASHGSPYDSTTLVSLLAYLWLSSSIPEATESIYSTIWESFQKVYSTIQLGLLSSHTAK